jgi:hypothetical protein
MILLIIDHHWTLVTVLALWWQLSRSAKLLPHLRRRPTSFFYIPGYIATSWLMALIKIHALATIRQQRWLTRQVAVENGTVVRTNTGTTDTAHTGTAGTRTPDKAQPEDVSA